MPTDEVMITEVLLRDGLQIELVLVTTPDKLRLGRGLIDAGFSQLEVGAFVRPDAVPQMADSAEVLSGLAGSAATLHTLVFTPSGARRAIAAGARHVRLILSASILTDAGVALEATLATALVCPFDGETDPSRAAVLAEELTGLGAQVVH